MQPIVLFNTSWMTHYLGRTASDKPINGGQWVVKTGKGGEVWNFKPIKGICYGYVSTTRNAPLNLARISGSENTDYIDGITVVFTATPPYGGRVAIGWYRNARVWRDYQTRGLRGDRKGWSYLVEAKDSDCVLLAPDDRVFPIPRARKGVWGMGQSHVRYLDGEGDAARFRKRLAKHINAPATTKASSPQGGKRSRGSGRQSDPELRAKVEKAAISRVWEYYDSRDFGVVSRESENVGWDLEVSRGKRHFLVEVKGCSGDNPAVEVTPNEYKQMQKNRHVYRLAIVTNALNKRKAVLSIVSYNISDELWRDQNGRLADIKKLIAARIAL